MTSSTCIAVDASTTHCMMDAVYLDSSVTTTLTNTPTVMIVSNEITAGFFGIVFSIFLITILVFANIWKR